MVWQKEYVSCEKCTSPLWHLLITFEGEILQKRAIHSQVLLSLFLPFSLVYKVWQFSSMYNSVTNLCAQDVYTTSSRKFLKDVLKVHPSSGMFLFWNLLPRKMSVYKYINNMALQLLWWPYGLHLQKLLWKRKPSIFQYEPKKESKQVRFNK